MTANAGDGSPLFVLATRLYVHYKFKSRNTFSPEAALIDDAYAREVLAQVRVFKDKTLQELADRFEEARFPGAKAQGGPSLDLALDTP